MDLWNARSRKAAATADIEDHEFLRYEGRLSVGLTNLTSRKVALSHLDDLLTVEFHRLSEPVERVYSGPYQSQSSLSNEDLEAVLEREVMSLSEMNTTLRSLAVNVKSLEESITN